MTTDDLSTLSFDIMSLHAAYAAGLSPARVMVESLRRIAACGDPAIFLHLRGTGEVTAAADGLPPFDPEAFPLWGIPFAVKDNIDIAGVPTTAACPAFSYEAEEDAGVVAHLVRAGAIWIGKTNLDQFATGLVGVRSPYGVPLNAIDPAIVPGGSSSGSGVAVARGLVSLALGTDTAGSGRVPAALNNIVGLKPSLGALSARGMVPACRTLDTMSVFALTVDDAWRAFAASCAPDPADAYSRAIPAAPELTAPPPVLSIGVPDAATRVFLGDAEQEASLAATLEALRDMGHHVVELDFTPFYDVARMLYEGPWVAERMAAVEPLFRADPGAFHPVTARIIGGADQFTAADAFRAYYRLEALKRRAEAAMAGIDLLCVPTIPRFVTLEEIAADPIGPNSALGTYTNFVNLLDMCGIAVPVAPRGDGRPGNVTLLARGGQDGLTAALARVLHEAAAVPLGATGWSLPARPPAPTPVLQTGEMAIALVGAHMAGLPLNREMTGRGARFLEATRTAPEYRLFRLDGPPPARPGLIRSAEGAAISVEIWAMPVARVGDFLAGIPSPLGLGTLRLEDGRTVTGFLAEMAGLAGAEDITASGGWRAWLADRAG